MKWLKNRGPNFFIVLLFVLSFIWKLWIHTSGDGGNDVLCDVEKTLMVLQGLNPYSISAWKSPYPPFYFIVTGGILEVGTGFNAVGSPVTLLVFTLRYAALMFDLVIGLIIYLTLLKKIGKGFYTLLSLGLYLFVPSISSSEIVYEQWFHGDTFGYFFVALAVFFFVSKRYSLGSVFLGLSVIFKIHTVLALPLLATWFYRNKTGFMRNTAILGAVVFVGLVLPIVLVPDCYGVLVGFNTSAIPHFSYSASLFNLFYAVLPTFFQISVPLSTINLIWIMSTFALLVTMSWIVWRNYDKLDPVDIIVIGVIVWLLPLRQLPVHYLNWFIIPFLMRGRLMETLLIVSIQEGASLIFAYPSPNEILFHFAVGVICAMNEALALYLIVRKPALTKRFKSSWFNQLPTLFEC